MGSTNQSKEGYLAVGTSTAPSYPLDVVGTIQVTGFKMTTGAGVDKVLTTDASGVASWQTAAAGGVDTWITTQTCSTDYALQSVGKESKVCINKVDYSDVAYDVSCTNCLTDVEVASADTASDLICTDCIGPTEITDSYVLNTGDAMTGALAMGNNKITGLATPTVATDAATKGYVDAAGDTVAIRYIANTEVCPTIAGTTCRGYLNSYNGGFYVRTCNVAASAGGGLCFYSSL